MHVEPEDTEDCLYPLQSYREPLAILEVISDVAHVLLEVFKEYRTVDLSNVSKNRNSKYFWSHTVS